MSVKKKEKYKKKVSVQQPQSNLVVKKNEYTSKDHFYIYLIIFLFSFLLYGNTISHEYALDDCLMISENKFTLSGIHGIKDIMFYDTCKGFSENLQGSTTGGRYRPLSLVTFAIECEFFGKNPLVGHIDNMLLYILSGIFIFLVLKRILKKFPFSNPYLSIPFISTILFLAHPIHTEVVANIKSRDEILAFLFALMTIYFLYKYIDLKKTYFLLISALTFFLSLLSKEIAIVYTIIFPLILYFFSEMKIKKILQLCIPLFIVAVLFIILRQVVLQQATIEVVKSNDLVNNSFAQMNNSQKYATIIYTLGLYLKLMFFPHPLTYDYYPYHIPIMEWVNFKVILSLIVYLLLIFVALKGLKEKKFISFCLLIYLIPFSLTSNILFPVGVFMGERLLYTSSLGFVMFMAYLMIVKPTPFFKRLFYQPLIFLIPLLALYSFKTFNRNKAWKNDFVLYETDVKTSSNSTHSNHSYGKALFVIADTIKDKSKQGDKIDSASMYLERSFKLNPNDQNVNYLLGKIYGKYKNDLNKSIYYLNNAMNLNPDHIDSYNDLGIAYAMSGQFNKAIEIFENGLKKAPENKDLLTNISITYNNLGNKIKFEEYQNKLKLISAKKK